MKKTKLTTLLAWTLIASMAMTACAENADKKRNKKNKDDDETQPAIKIEVEDNNESQPTSEATEPTEATSEPTDAAVPVDYSYIDAYKDIVNNFNNYAEYASDGTNRNYDLIDVDGDSTPELVVEDGICMIYLFTYADGQIHTLMDGWPYGAGGNAGYAYAPGDNKFMNGNSDYAGGAYYIWYGYIDDNHELADEPVSIHSQAFPEGTEDPWDYLSKWNGESWYYFIDGKEVSRDEYEAANHPELSDWEYISGNYNKDEILYLLGNKIFPESKTSNYEVIVQDCTWEEAAAICESKGGHLATVSGIREWYEIGNVIEADSSDAFVYYVGGKQVDGKYVWTEDGSNMPIGNFWRKGEPSMTGKTEDGRTVDEDRLCILLSDGEHYKVTELLDVPDDIIDAAASYKGKVAFICEYD